MRIVLVNPCTNQQFQTHRHGVGHLGLGYVAACLLREGHDVIGIDAKMENLSPSATLERICDLGPDMVGVTATTHEIWHAGWLCAGVKAALPDCVTVVGGPHTTALPERTLKEFPGIDVAVRGEGEETACELAEAVEGGVPRYRWGNILGIAYRNGNDLHLNAPRPFITDLDALPFPAWEAFPRELYWPLYAGRGCPFRCAFCQRVLGHRIRMRSVDNVLAEMDAMEERLGSHTSWFQDETFGVDARWTNDFLDKLIARNEERGYIWRWKANSRANLADLELYRKMRRAGCRTLDFGIESGCQEVLERIQKNITLAQAREAIRCARQADIRVNAFFIIGHPGETWTTALSTVLLAPRLGADDIAVGVMVPYPGTEVWEMARRGEWGYTLLTEDWRMYDKYFGATLEVRHLSHRQLELLQVLTYLSFYVGTGRFVQLAKFVVRFRREALRMLKRLILTSKRCRTPDPQPAPRIARSSGAAAW
ncbi:MAG: radical SAM protein [Phycisphaerae bacterium]